MHKIQPLHSSNSVSTYENLSKQLNFWSFILSSKPSFFVHAQNSNFSNFYLSSKFHWHSLKHLEYQSMLQYLRFLCMHAQNSIIAFNKFCKHLWNFIKQLNFWSFIVCSKPSFFVHAQNLNFSNFYLTS